MNENTKKLDYETDEEKQWLLDVLKTVVVNIKFEKVDGSIREMKATLIPELLPKLPEPVLNENGEPKQVKVRKESTTAFKVFDAEKQEFRSIRWNSIISCNFEV